MRATSTCWAHPTRRSWRSPSSTTGYSCRPTPTSASISPGAARPFPASFCCVGRIRPPSPKLTYLPPTCPPSKPTSPPVPSSSSSPTDCASADCHLATNRHPYHLPQDHPDSQRVIWPRLRVRLARLVHRGLGSSDFSGVMTSSPRSLHNRRGSVRPTTSSPVWCPSNSSSASPTSGRRVPTGRDRHPSPQSRSRTSQCSTVAAVEADLDPLTAPTGYGRFLLPER